MRSLYIVGTYYVAAKLRMGFSFLEWSVVLFAEKKKRLMANPMCLLLLVSGGLGSEEDDNRQMGAQKSALSSAEYVRPPTNLPKSQTKLPKQGWAVLPREFPEGNGRARIEFLCLCLFVPLSNDARNSMGDLLQQRGEILFF